MSLKQTVRRWARSVNWFLFTVLDLQLIRRSQAEHADVFGTLRRLISGNETVIVDVGARRGGTVFSLHGLFPDARIDCFEPSTESFQLLQERFRSVPGIRCNHMAVAESSGIVKLHLSRTDATNSLLNADPEFAVSVDPRHVEVVGEEEVTAVSLDDYCSQEAIDQVRLLKIDIQGGELMALRGAQRLLAAGKIDTILTEVCFARLYEGQGLFWDIRDHVERHGYRLYGLYDLRHGRNGMLAWGDALFVSPQLVERLNQLWAGSQTGDHVAIPAS